jgi:translation initiation factor 4E
MEHPLQHAWVFYMHYPVHYKTQYDQKAYEAIGNPVTTVEDFWRYEAHIPKCSEVFTQVDVATGTRRTAMVDKRRVEGFGMFVQDVLPVWEDEANKAGGHWELKTSIPGPLMDEVWRYVLMGMVGQTLSDAITGARFVDKSRPKLPRSEYRLEVWMRQCDEGEVDGARRKILECIEGVFTSKDMPVPEMVYRQHAESIELSIKKLS